MAKDDFDEKRYIRGARKWTKSAKSGRGEVAPAKLEILKEYFKIIELLSPEQRKKFFQLLTSPSDVWKREFCRSCSECFACKEDSAPNLGWIKRMPICLCDRCYKYLISGRSKELYRILEKKKIRPFMTYYHDGPALLSFEKEEDEDE